MALAQFPLTFEFVPGLWLSAGLAVVLAAAAWPRRGAGRASAVAAAVAGVLCLALAAGSPALRRRVARKLVVMADVSPSTRTADYRDRAVLDRRIRDLVGDTPFELRFFADGFVEVDRSAARLADAPAERTRYPAPDAPAVLLFSDCRFALPSWSPPTYVVIDPGLEDVEDASVGELRTDGKDVRVAVRNTGGTRRMTLSGTVGAAPIAVPVGSTVFTRPARPEGRRFTAELSPGDAWPENDALATVAPPPVRGERWWIGAQPPAGDWRALGPGQLPSDAASFLAPSIVVLDNVSASELSTLQQDALRRYVRDLGGGMLILGGDDAFAAGSYTGTAIDALSPLASHPPEPVTHWVLLVDASGSMSSEAAGRTRWDYATAAVTQLLASLPREDLCSVGSFSDGLRWWVRGRSVADAVNAPLPPAGTYPSGPTNLQPAVEAIARSADANLPIRLLVVSDFDTHIDAPDALVALLRQKRVRLDLLAIGEGTALPTLRIAARELGGRVVTQLDPRQWTSSARALASAADSAGVRDEPIRAEPAAGSGLVPFTLTRWNPAWLKQSATPLADAKAADGKTVIAARWQLGSGRVAALAGVPAADVIAALADSVQTPPRDPRYRVNWTCGAALTVTVEAADAGQYLNGERVELELRDPDAPAVASPPVAVPQSAPGRYEVSAPAPRSPMIAIVRAGGRTLNRIALAGRYAAEFEALGNDPAAMAALAGRSGGQVVRPSQTGRLNIRFPERPVPVTPWFATGGAVLLAGAYALQRRSA